MGLFCKSQCYQEYVPSVLDASGERDDEQEQDNSAEYSGTRFFSNMFKIFRSKHSSLVQKRKLLELVTNRNSSLFKARSQ